MARHTTARRWALALPATVVAAVAGGIALTPAGTVVQATAAPIAPAEADAPVQATTAAPTPAADTDTSVKGSSAPAKVSVRTLALGSASNPTGGARVSTAQPAGVPLAFTAEAAAELRVLRTAASGTPFSAIGVSWQRDPSLGRVSVAVRSRATTSAPWSSWTTAASGESDDRNGTNAVPADLREGPGLVWTDEAVAAEVVVTTVSGRQPVDVKVDLINPGVTASDAAAADVSAATASASPEAVAEAVASAAPAAPEGEEVASSDPLVPAAAAAPNPASYGNGVVKIYSRAAWGANAAYMKWTPKYASKVNAVVVHHTATSNNYTAAQVPAIIRSIYHYMAVTEKYGDMGYNVLIDRFGRVWEGRYGGLTRAVVAAHAGGFNSGTSGIGIIGDHTKVAVSAAAKEAVARYSAFKLGTAKANPTGTTSLTGGPSTKFKSKVTVKLPTIYPHQSTSSTACPGKYGMAIMSWVRTRAKTLVASYKLGTTIAVKPVVTKPTAKPTPKPTATPKPTPTVKPTPTTTPTAPPTAGPTTPVATANGTTVPAAGLTLYGAGFGHGRGMSQYGAKGAAKQGLSATKIVNFYYPGAALTAKGNPTLRVRLSAIDGGHFTFAPTSGTTVTGLVATAANGTTVALPARSGWHVARSGASYLIQEKVGTAWATAYTLAAPVTFSGPASLTVNYSAAKNDCRGGTSVTFNGSLTALVADNTARYVASMPVDTYLRGVVASEMPSSWSAAALQAQAIAARTYATAKITSSRYYDVIDTQANQCWDGKLSEAAATNAAITATAGKVLTVGGKVISAEFSSDSGGYTASGGVSYLPAKADPYTLAAESSATNWTKVLTPAQLAAVDGAAGLTKVTAVKVTKRTGFGRWGGRVETVQLTGTTAAGKVTTATVTGADFRTRLGLRSTYLGFTK
ncbi:SpoIID/LytB domain-containing protein [Cryptosporangium aurantiacum]|uniref:SpoIID/LytB domain protein n=1 Tax=Cryptosporangium aurantiacum TaxID=134849 RepID=A0A1M7QUN6_9ACTN|nr:SpoIID/LytB domain-containing protein [Cryptosporangium aurantiacum]SHN35536.1 SpoIID/LytB domain protein [Cryptosporangium aurantiacum]